MQEFVDVTLAAGGHLVKAHQNILALASPYLKEMLKSAPCQHPIIFLGVSFEMLRPYPGKSPGYIEFVSQCRTISRLCIIFYPLLDSNIQFIPVYLILFILTKQKIDFNHSR